MQILVTGGAGFIGSHLVDGLLREPSANVTVIDDLSSGRRVNLQAALSSGRVTLLHGSLLDPETFAAVQEAPQAIFHLAANGDIQLGAEDTDLDLRNGVMATRNVLDAALRLGTREVVFASSSAVYGSPALVPTPESYGPLIPESLYGAAKLAAEGYVSAYCHSFDLQGWIFRFANIVGPRTRRGATSEFVAQAVTDGNIRMLSDGTPAKNFTHVSDCVAAVIHLWKQARSSRINIFNVGSTGRVNVRGIAEEIAQALQRDVPIVAGSKPSAWPGDIVNMELDCSAASRYGWEPEFDCVAAVRRGVADLIAEMQTGEKAEP